ncbi:MAG: YggS family pyridoxal phosphate-dependent enzyme [Thermoguttaceae bacterium]
MDTVAKRVEFVRERIAVAASKSGRSATDIHLIAVTKYETGNVTFLEELFRAGCADFGEARVQELLRKVGLFSSLPTSQTSLSSENVSLSAENVHWHFIGPLQRNKVRRVLPICTLIHSVGSLNLVETIDRIAREEALTKKPEILLEVNISGEEAKQGFAPCELPGVLEQLEKFSALIIRGFMGMSGLHSNESQKRREFALLRNCAESLRQQCPENVQLQELSIGMSDDFELAIEEGATLIRIGSLLYP